MQTLKPDLRWRSRLADLCRRLQGESLLPKLFPLLRLLPGVSYLRALEVVALLPGEAELDLRPGALDDGRERQVRPETSTRDVVRARCCDTAAEPQSEHPLRTRCKSLPLLLSSWSPY